MQLEQFVGREAEVRTIVGNVELGHSTLIIGEEGVGKTALLEVVHLIIEDKTVIFTERITPFGSFLKEMFRRHLKKHKRNILTHKVERWT